MKILNFKYRLQWW